jgi:xanthine/uracil permease
MTSTSQWWRYVAGANSRPSYATRWLAVAAAVEAGTGLFMMVSPVVFVGLLLGAELSEPGQALGRLAGFALLALGLACWPAAQAQSRTGAALRAMLIYSLLTTAYLLYLGIATDLVGLLLWPAIAFHAAATLLLGRAWLGDPRRKGPRNQVQD